MLAKSVSRLTAPPRRALNLTQAGLTASGDLARQLRDTLGRVDEVLSDVHAMRQIVERLDSRVAYLQRQVDSFNTRIEHVERVTETVAADVKKGTDRLPDPNDTTINKLKSALAPSSDHDEGIRA